MNKKIQSSWKYIPRSLNNFRLEKGIRFFLRGCEALGHRPAIVFRHAIFPFEKIGDRLRLDANFDPLEAGEKQVHFVAKAPCQAEVGGGVMNQSNFPAPKFEQSPACRQFVSTDDAGRREVETLASHTDAGLHAKRFFLVREEIAA